MPVIIGKNSFNQWPIRIPDATPAEAGVMTPADKAKLDALSPGGGALYGVQAQVTYDNSVLPPGLPTCTIINSFGGITYDSLVATGTTFGFVVYFLLPTPVPDARRQVWVTTMVEEMALIDPFTLAAAAWKGQGSDYLGIILGTNAQPSGSPTVFNFCAQLFVIP